MKQAQRGQRRRGVDTAADEVPQDVQQLRVVESLAVELELDEEARQVVAGIGPPGRGELQQAVEHRGDFGDRLVVLVAVRGAAITEWNRLA